MKNTLKLLAVMLVLTISLVPVLVCTVSAEDTTNMVESTDTPSGMDTDRENKDDGGIIGDITGALTSEADKDTGKDTDRESEKDTETNSLVSDIESMMPDKESNSGNISTGDNGTIDETPKDDDAGMSTWAIIIAIIIIAAVVILIFAMMPKKKD